MLVATSSVLAQKRIKREFSPHVTPPSPKPPVKTRHSVCRVEPWLDFCAEAIGEQETGTALRHIAPSVPREKPQVGSVLTPFPSPTHSPRSTEPVVRLLVRHAGSSGGLRAPGERKTHANSPYNLDRPTPRTCSQPAQAGSPPTRYQSRNAHGQAEPPPIRAAKPPHAHPAANCSPASVHTKIQRI